MNVIAGIISAATALIQGNWSGAWEAIKGVAQTVWEGIKSVISTVINAISTVISTVLGTIQNTVTTIWNGIKDFISNAINNIKDTVINVANSLKDGFMNVLDSLKNGVSNAIDAVKGFFDRLWNIDLSGAGRAIMEGFLNGLKAAWGAVTDFVGGIASWIAEHKGPISYDRRLLTPAGQAIMGGFNTALTNGFEYVKSNVSQDKNTEYFIICKKDEDTKCEGEDIFNSRVNHTVFIRLLCLYWWDGICARACK